MKSEVIKRVDKSNDLFIPGNLYEYNGHDLSKLGPFIVLCTDSDNQKSEDFSGVIVYSDMKNYPDNWKIGHYSNVWNKSVFKPFYGIITLTEK